MHIHSTAHLFELAKVDSVYLKKIPDPVPEPVAYIPLVY